MKQTFTPQVQRKEGIVESKTSDNGDNSSEPGRTNALRLKKKESKGSMSLEERRQKILEKFGSRRAIQDRENMIEEEIKAEQEARVILDQLRLKWEKVFGILQDEKSNRGIAEFKKLQDDVRDKLEIPFKEKCKAVVYKAHRLREINEELVKYRQGIDNADKLHLPGNYVIDIRWIIYPLQLFFIASGIFFATQQVLKQGNNSTLAPTPYPR